MIVRQITIFCDECGEEGDTNLYAAIVIEKARSDGWKIGKRHRCPDCVDGIPLGERETSWSG